MTSIDYKRMMKQAKEQLAKQSSNPKEEDPGMQMDGPILASDNSASSDSYNISRFEYDIEVDHKKFHQIFQKYQVGELDSVYYIPDFISKEQEQSLLESVRKIEINEQDESKWTVLKRRRLQNWGGFPQIEGMLQEELPIWLRSICSLLLEQSVFPIDPNHVLINEYKGDEGIHAHKDGPLYYPRVAIVSLSGSTLMTFRSSLSQKESDAELLLYPRSLLLFTNKAYTDMFHEIPVSGWDTVSDKCINSKVIGATAGESFLRSTRVSLTIRVVPNTKILKNT